MRRMLVDHERKRRARKRGGGGGQRLPIEPQKIAAIQSNTDLLALNDTLEQLAQLDPRQSEIVDLHHFGGATFEETARILGISRSTVKREWTAAKAWLHLQLSRN